MVPFFLDMEGRRRGIVLPVASSKRGSQQVAQTEIVYLLVSGTFCVLWLYLL